MEASSPPPARRWFRPPADTPDMHYMPCTLHKQGWSRTLRRRCAMRGDPPARGTCRRAPRTAPALRQSTQRDGRAPGDEEAPESTRGGHPVRLETGGRGGGGATDRGAAAAVHLRKPPEEPRSRHCWGGSPSTRAAAELGAALQPNARTRATALMEIFSADPAHLGFVRLAQRMIRAEPSCAARKVA